MIVKLLLVQTISDRIAIQVNSHKALCPVSAINGQLSPSSGLIGWPAGRKLSQVLLMLPRSSNPLTVVHFFDHVIVFDDQVNVMS